MKAKLILGTAMAAACVIVAGCNDATNTLGKRPAEPANWISVPALPIIQDAVISLSPTFNGRRDAGLTAQLCAMARGVASQQQVNARLAQMGIDAMKLPQRSDDAVALLVNGDRAGQAAACAAFQATAVLSPADTSEFMVAAPAAKPEESGAKDKAKSETKEETKPRPGMQVDNQRLTQSLQRKIAQARANADVFALIATEMQRTPGLGIGQYREQAGALFARLAPEYLERVQMQMPPAAATFDLQKMDASHLVFGSNLGTRFEYSADTGLVLRQNGQLWFGKGRLLGEDYRVKVAYFPAEVAALLPPGKGKPVAKAQ